MPIKQEIQQRLNEVRARIADALARVHRPPEACRLVLATKTQPADALLAAYQAGARDFGENYVQEATTKRRALEKLCAGLICHPEPAACPESLEGSTAHAGEAPNKRDLSSRAGEQRAPYRGTYAKRSALLNATERPSRGNSTNIDSYRAPSAHLTDLTWHLIGHLQTNKTAVALATFSFIQTLDSERLATTLHRLQPAPAVRTLLEINLGGESSKTGVAPDQAEALLAGIRDKVEVLGLMTIPPYSIDPSRSRPYFVRLRGLRDRLAAVSGLALSELSMGMTDDYTLAIEEGATIVRVGRAVFGERT